MVKLKIGKTFFDITERDVILFNGACWQLISQKVYKDWHDYSPKVSKTMCEKFVRKGILVMYKKEQEYTTMDGKQMGLYYYKFDIDKLNEYMSQ